MSTKLPKGVRASTRSAIPDDDFFEVPTLASVAGVNRTQYYWLVKQGRAPRPRKGVPRREAIAWLESRAEEAAARAETRKAALAEVRAKEVCSE